MPFILSPNLWLWAKKVLNNGRVQKTNGGYVPQVYDARIVSTITHVQMRQKIPSQAEGLSHLRCVKIQRQTFS